MALTVTEALYGGAAGGGKSEALLIAALQFVHVPNYAALLLRRTFSDLNQPGALIMRSFSWLGGTDARWRGSDHAWEFPSGAILKFGYLDNPLDKLQYQSAEFQFCGFDELTQFRESDYRYMFSRLRKLKGVNIPLRMRSGSNPGGLGHDWVKQRFLIDGQRAGRVFVPAKIKDNPSLDSETYRQTLSNLDPITRKQLEDGDWSARQAGSMFQREWFEIIPALPNFADLVRYWDKAATKEGKGARTSGTLMGRTKEGIFVVIDVKTGRWSSAEREQIIKQTCQLDRQQFGYVKTWVEQEPGSGGKESAENTIKNLAGFSIEAERVTGDKASRAAPLANQAYIKNVKLLSGPWNAEFIDEIEAFPDGALKDQVDSTSGAFNKLALGRSGVIARADDVGLRRNNELIGSIDRLSMKDF